MPKYNKNEGGGSDNPGRTDKERGNYLSEMPALLDMIIHDWGKELSRQLNRPVNYWKELSILTGRAVSTLRSYTDDFNPVYPPIDVLISICKATGRDEPLRLVEEIRKVHFGEAEK